MYSTVEYVVKKPLRTVSCNYVQKSDRIRVESESGMRRSRVDGESKFIGIRHLSLTC